MTELHKAAHEWRLTCEDSDQSFVKIVLVTC